MLGHPAFGPHGDPVTVSGPPIQRDPKASKPWRCLTCFGSIALLFGWWLFKDFNRWLHVQKKGPAITHLLLFWGGWAWMICIWSRLLHNGGCLLLTAAFYEPRSRAKPDSTLAFQSFLGLQTMYPARVCSLSGCKLKAHQMVFCMFFANGVCSRVCTHRLCWQAHALHTCMNK